MIGIIELSDVDIVPPEGTSGTTQVTLVKCRATYRVVTWGHPLSGGDSSKVAASLAEGVTYVVGNGVAFAAVKVGGSVVTWGQPRFGRDSSAVAARLAEGVTSVVSCSASFAAVKADGSVVTWV